MVSFAELRAARPAAWHDLARAWRQFASGAREHVSEFGTAMEPLAYVWTGPSAVNANRSVAALADQMTGALARVDRIPEVYNRLGDRSAVAQVRLEQAVRDARGTGLQVRADGSVMPLEAAPGPQLAATIQRVGAEFQAAVTEANAADAEASAALRSLMPTAAELTLAQSSLPPIPQGRPPAEVKQWWDSLSAGERESLLFARPEVLGNLDGVPAEARDRANRVALAEHKAALTEQQHLLEAKGEMRTDAEDALLTDVSGKLAGIEAIEQRIAVQPAGTPPAFLLGFDTTGPGHAIVAVGNPDAAANVATYVPGVSNDLSGIGGGIQRADRMFDAATRYGSTSTSVISWFGYDTPSSPFVPAAWGDDAAKAGAPKLNSFQDGLRATHQAPPSRNTVVAHSYGSVVAGEAAQRGDGLAVDNLVAVGSPGMDVGRAADLHLAPGGQVWASQAHNDPIPDLAYDAGALHGPPPTMRGFGARGFDSGWGGWNPLTAHSNYWADDSPALRNMGKIIAGTI